MGVEISARNDLICLRFKNAITSFIRIPCDLPSSIFPGCLLVGSCIVLLSGCVVACYDMMVYYAEQYTQVEQFNFQGEILQ